MFIFLSVNHVLFSGNRKVVDTALNIVCLLVSGRLIEAEIGLMPLPSHKAKAHKVIWEILP